MHMNISRRSMLGAGAATVALLATSRAQAQTDASGQLASVLDQTVTAMLRLSPERCTSLGISEERAGGRFVDRLSDSTEAARTEYRGVLETALSRLRAIDRASLPPRDLVTVDVVATSFENSISNMSFAAGAGAGAPYVVTQLTGAYTGIPDFLDAQHPLRSRDETEAYFARLDYYPTVLDQESAQIGEHAADGVVPPDFAIDKAIEQLRAFIAGPAADTVLVQTLVRRLPEVGEISESDRASYVERAVAAVSGSVFPAYQRQIEALQAVRRRARHDAGCWRLPQGAEMYQSALRSRTTTTLTPDEIHDMGVELVRDFQAQMDAILRAQGLTRGSVAARIQELSRRPDQLYPNTDEGRAQILADLNEQTRIIAAMMPRAFNTLAQAELEIRRVPAYTEAGAPGGYYQRAALDGSRPGAYYINLRNTDEWPRFTLPTLNYHEGVPGHHWQIAIQQESGAIPFIRSAMLGFSSFSEGWALYAEQLADELGIYENDQLGRLGYLQSATFRASRLVVDTGIHHKRWSRERAIRSMMAATGDQESSVATEIERYAVWPGQACSYMVGRQEINRLRARSETALGQGFDLKAFHDTILANGAVPLSVLDRIVQTWADTQGA
jgi:uncharacterized protein (DUF885 family)